MEKNIPLLVNETWYPIPGSTSARIYPLIRKPDITSSNAYLLHIGDYLILIDTGAQAEITDRLFALLMSISTPAKQILVIFSHVHYDHVYQGLVDRRYGQIMQPVYISHTAGADILEAGDPDGTVSYIVGFPVTPSSVDLRLFTGLSAGDQDQLRHTRL